MTEDEKQLLDYGWKVHGEELWLIEHDGEWVEAVTAAALMLMAQWQGVPVVVPASVKQPKPHKPARRVKR